MSLSPAFEALWPALLSPLGADLLRQDAPYTSIAQAVHEGLMGPVAVNHKVSNDVPPALAAWWMDQLYKPLSTMVDRHENPNQRDVLGLQLVQQGYLVTQQWREGTASSDLLQLALAHGHVALAQTLHALAPQPLHLLSSRLVSVRASDVCVYGAPGKPLLPERLPVLHAAIALGYVEMAQWLLDKGVPVDARDESGQTPLFQARSQATRDVLLKAGANPGATDNWGCSVFDRRMPTQAQVARVLAKSLLDNPDVVGISPAQRLSALLPQIDAGISLKLLKPQLKALGNDVSLTVDTSTGRWSLLGWIAKAQAHFGRSAELLAWAMDKSTKAICLPGGYSDQRLALDAAWAYFDVEELGSRLKKGDWSTLGIDDFKESMLRIRTMNNAGPSPSTNNSDAAGRAMSMVLNIALVADSVNRKPKHAELFDFLPATPQAWVSEDAQGRTPLGRCFEAWADYLEQVGEKPYPFAHSNLGQWRLSRHSIPSDVAAPALRVLASLLGPSSLPEKEDPDASIQSLASLSTMGPWQTAPSFTQELAWWVNIASSTLPGRVPDVAPAQWESCMQKMKQAQGLWSDYAHAWSRRRLEASLPSAPTLPKVRM